MSVFLIGTSTLASFVKMLILLIFFVLILVASYYFTKWYARSGFMNSQSQNIQVLESYLLGPGKQICIIKVGNKCIAIAICKEKITVLAELDESQLVWEEKRISEAGFGEIFSNMVKQKMSGREHKK